LKSYLDGVRLKQCSNLLSSLSASVEEAVILLIWVSLPAEQKTQNIDLFQYPVFRTIPMINI